MRKGVRVRMGCVKAYNLSLSPSFYLCLECLLLWVTIWYSQVFQVKYSRRRRIQGARKMNDSHVDTRGFKERTVFSSPVRVSPVTHS
ncbi:hypothetical protein F4809DRAFT_624101 [Biscogniauxia mediterranea]|nr:hypothetical protein F4809DRAFT_624101 [Biscogniauxia mediterranea]